MRLCVFFRLTAFAALMYNLYCVNFIIAGWSSPVARRAHNPKVAGSNPVPATNVCACRGPLAQLVRAVGS